MPARTDGGTLMRPAGLTGVTWQVPEYVAALFATRQLADLGARVSRSNAPAQATSRGYDTAVKGEASHFVWIVRSKESITPTSREPAREAGAPSGARTCSPTSRRAPRRGSGCEPAEEQPELITCSITGYGDAGPAAPQGVRPAVQAESGLMSITGPQDTARAPRWPISRPACTPSGILPATGVSGCRHAPFRCWTPSPSG